MEKELNYSQAYEKLEEVVEQLEDGNIQLDTLAEKVKQANELIAVCEAALRKIEKELDDTATL